MTMKLFSLVVALASLANAAATAKNHHPICVALEDKGYKTVIFEKRDTVGGKCQSHYEDWRVNAGLWQKEFAPIGVPSISFVVPAQEWLLSRVAKLVTIN
ncbi:hypothetical protein BKA59DRAFT_488916 [Fusarium tricinctum]|uniref:Uncharacterized protein n=1 Tax=Fusarium tricinctum TaxID=61284 RepID=A0A8K0W4V8_9HYPO|nr:hypothetical protein BKA59DRAFT_488916 [Fusarium tricinctum]